MIYFVRSTREGNGFQFTGRLSYGEVGHHPPLPKASWDSTQDLVLPPQPWTKKEGLNPAKLTPATPPSTQEIRVKVGMPPIGRQNAKINFYLQCSNSLKICQ